MNGSKGQKRLWHSFKHALNGIAYVIDSQRNMKIHLGMALIVLVLSVLFNISGAEMIWVIFAIFFVLCMETLNTAIERTVDLMTTEYHPLAKLAKDISAGAVLFATAFAVVTGILVFAAPILKYFSLDIGWTLEVPVIMLILGFLLFVTLFTRLKRKE